MMLAQPTKPFVTTSEAKPPQPTPKDIGSRLAERFVNHSVKNVRDVLKLGSDKSTQTLLFKLLESIGSGISVFGLMYGLDSLMIAGVISSFGAYFALFSVGLLLKNVIFAWLTNNHLPRSLHIARTIVMLLTFFMMTSLLLSVLLLFEAFAPFIIFISVCLDLEETYYFFYMFKWHDGIPAPGEIDVSSLGKLISTLWGRVPVAFFLTVVCVANIFYHIITTPLTLAIKLLLHIIRLMLVVVCLPIIQQWGFFYNKPLKGNRLDTVALNEMRDTVYHAIMNNPIRYWADCWLDIMNFSPRWNEESDSFIVLKQFLKECPESKGIIELAKRIASKEVEQVHYMTPKDHLSFLLTDYLSYKGVSVLFKQTKPDALIARTLLAELQSDSSTIHLLHATLTTHQESSPLSSEFQAIAQYVEYVLVPMEAKMEPTSPAIVPETVGLAA